MKLKHVFKEKNRSLIDKFVSISISIAIFISFFLFVYQYYTVTVFNQLYNSEKEKKFSVYSNLILGDIEDKLVNNKIGELKTFIDQLKSDNILLYIYIGDNTDKNVILKYPEALKGGLSISSDDSMYNRLKVYYPNITQQNIIITYNTLSHYTVVMGLYDSNSIPVLSKVILEGNMKLILVFILFSFVSAIVLFRLISRPIKDLVKGTEEFSQGNLAYRVNISSNDEIGLLANSFNTMANRLSVLYTSLEQRVKDRTKDLETANVELEGAYKQLKETQAMLIHNEKMQSLGQLVAGVAHEINNPINFIYGNLDHLKNYCNDMFDIIDAYEEATESMSDEELDEVLKLKDDIDYDFLLDDLPELIKSCKEGAERCKEIVLNLKNFSRLDEAVLKEVDIHEGINSTLNILNNKIKNRITIHKEYGNLPRLTCYAGQINQVFMNILDNSSQAIEGNGDIYIRTSLINNDIVIEFEDNGKGIEKENLNKIFDPFYTTKPVGEGTGLGLSISFKIIKTHNGSITVTSEKNVGTKFLIKIPLDWYNNIAENDNETAENTTENTMTEK